MKVLILYPTENQVSLIKGCVDHLDKKGIQVFALNRNAWTYYASNCPDFNIIIKYLERWKYVMKWGVSQRMVFHSSFLISKSIGYIYKYFDIVDYNFYSDVVCNKLIVYGTSARIKQVISIWGSDFYRVSNEVKEKRRKYLDLVDAIHVETVNVKHDFCHFYNDFASKVIACNYGIDLFSTIDGLVNADRIPSRDTFYRNNIGDKIIITCGYNARKGQQHELMISALERLPDSLKKIIHVVFPLTYASGDSVVEDIENRLKNVNYGYTCVKNLLSLEELAILRFNSDIYINLQTTDSFSSSTMEYFYTGNIVIIGKWLPYKFLKEEHNINYVETTKEGLTDILAIVLNNFEKYKSISSKNCQPVRELCSWPQVADKLASMYKGAYSVQ